MVVRRGAARWLATALGLVTVAPAAARAQWRFVAPDAAGAWYAALDSLRLEGPGAFPFHRSTGPAALPLARTLAVNPQFEILHFVPLYFPSGNRAAVVEAVRRAASGADPASPRARFVVGTLRQALPTAAERSALQAVADLTSGMQPAGVPEHQLVRWQQRWNDRFAPGLARYLADRRLDGGIVIVADALGLEGRLFAGVPTDRRDNIVAVGTPLGATDEDGPLFAVVRELCFPLISDAAEKAPGLGRDSREAARRTSLAAVRCGADLLDRFVPAEAVAYRDHWRNATGAVGAFDALFPPDPVLAPRLRTALDRLVAAP